MKSKMRIFVLLIIPLFFACSNTNESVDKTVDVALYSDKGCWDNSVTAAQKMYEWMGLSVELVNSEYINDNSLSDFKIISFPGGDMYQYSQDISTNGKEMIKEFIKTGGGYIGLCGGAYFACENVIWQGNQLNMESLGIIPAVSEGPFDEIVPYPEYGMCEVVISDTSHYITKTISDTLQILYYWGPVLKPNNPNVSVLAEYTAINQPAILASTYGRGKVFITGAHPEIEENSDRDGVVFRDTTINGTHYVGEDRLDDKGSDWDLIKNAVDWCLNKYN